MVVIAIAAALFAATITGYAVYQWQELRAADKRITDLLAMNAGLAAANADLEAEGQATRLVLGLAMRKNAQLQRDNLDHETSLLLVLGELEGVS